MSAVVEKLLYLLKDCDELTELELVEFPFFFGISFVYANTSWWNKWFRWFQAIIVRVWPLWILRNIILSFWCLCCSQIKCHIVFVVWTARVGPAALATWSRLCWSNSLPSHGSNSSSKSCLLNLLQATQNGCWWILAGTLFLIALAWNHQ